MTGFAKSTTKDGWLILDMGKVAKSIDFTCSGWVNWQWTRSTLFGGESKSVVTMRFTPDWVEFRYAQRGEDVTPYRAAVLRTTPHYGGVRLWWGCPGCGRRVRILYGVPFVCRECHDLTYETRQTARPYALIDAMHNRMYAIRRKLGGEGGLLASLSEKPKTMHWDTYARLEDEYWMLQAASICAMGLAVGKKGKLVELPGVDDETVMEVWNASKRERKPPKRAPALSPRTWG